MRRRFVVAIDALTKPQQTRISQYVSEAGCGWWHWIENFWLLTTKQDNFNFEAFTDMLHEMSPNGRWVALEIPEDITGEPGTRQTRRDVRFQIGCILLGGKRTSRSVSVRV